jgi:hypothetical protein
VATWAQWAALLVAIVVTYARLDPAELYHDSRDGLGGGLSRALVVGRHLAQDAWNEQLVKGDLVDGRTPSALEPVWLAILALAAATALVIRRAGVVDSPRGRAQDPDTGRGARGGLGRVVSRAVDPGTRDHRRAA